MSWMTRILGIIRANSGLAYVGLGNFIALAIHGLFWFLLASMLTAEYYGELNYGCSNIKRNLNVRIGYNGGDIRCKRFQEDRIAG